MRPREQKIQNFRS